MRGIARVVRVECFEKGVVLVYVGGQGRVPKFPLVAVVLEEACRKVEVWDGVVMGSVKVSARVKFLKSDTDPAVP